MGRVPRIRITTMPVYEFECQTCGQRFEELMRLSDPDPTECRCGKAQPVRRVLTAPAFRLAGTGWYETDFKKDGDRKRNLAGDAEPTKANGEGKSEAKPADTDAAPTPPKAEAKPAAGPAAPAG
jgi:putative FmdB family regulatory protein